MFLRSGKHDYRDFLKKCFVVLPGADIKKLVHTDYQEICRVLRRVLLKGLHSIDGIGASLAPKLYIRYGKARVRTYRPTYHLPPVPGIDQSIGILVRGQGGRYKIDAIQTKSGFDLLCRPKMGHVNRVKRSAKQSCALHHRLR